MLSNSVKQLVRVLPCKYLRRYYGRNYSYRREGTLQKQEMSLTSTGAWCSRQNEGLYGQCQIGLHGPLLTQERSLHSGKLQEQASTRKVVSEEEAGTNHPGVGEVGVSGNRKLVILNQVQGQSASFNATWLRHNCHCSKCQQPHSGQRLLEPTELQPSYKIQEASIRDELLLIQWEGESDHGGQIPLSFLQENEYSAEKRQEAAQTLHYPRFCQNGQIPTVSYEEVKSSDIGMLRWLQNLNEEGICLVRDVPCKEGMVKEITESAWPVQRTIYGEIFDVVSDPKPINVAYSSVRLGFHMDLIYYESAPGLQMLHCLQFDKQVEGGESMLVDAWHTAEVLRESYPEQFATLCRVPATFQKIHFDREHPVYMKYKKPHIECCPEGHIIAVNWAPAFEGPLCVDEKFVENYYEAYHLYAKLLDESPTRVEFRLEEGDMLSFNNRRILHARKEFKLNGGKRHLQGCYMNIDEFKSRLMVLSHKLQSETPVKHVFNHDWH